MGSEKVDHPVYKIMNTDGHRSIRKRAQHRARKRGELWIRINDTMNDAMNRLAIDFYSGENTIFGMCGLSDIVKGIDLKIKGPSDPENAVKKIKVRKQES